MKALVLSLVALAGIALAGAVESPTFRSRRAQEARKTFEKTVERLEAEYQAKLRKARDEYVKSLEAALKEAKKAKDDAETALIRKTIGELRSQGSKTSKAAEKIGRYVFAGGKGDTLEAAVVIQVATDSTEAVEAEGLWLKKHYPAFTKRAQALLHEGEKTYDEIEIHSPDGKVKKIYFDITGCFGFPELRRGG